MFGNLCYHKAGNQVDIIGTPQMFVRRRVEDHLQEFPDTEKTDDHSEKHDETDAQDCCYRHTGPAALCPVLCERELVITAQLPAAVANSPRRSCTELQIYPLQLQ